MKNCLLMIDGGTTNTRFTLMDGDKILTQTQRRVGATDTKQANENHLLEQSVKSEVQRLQAEHDCVIRDVYASGMITSATGLMEIEHICAPVTIEQLAAQMQTRTLEGLPAIQFHFVPGIKFLATADTGPDIMRGEEVEIFGALAEEDWNKDLLFIHFGSHNKMMRVDHGTIAQGTTTLSGELLWAVCNDTILKSAVPHLDTDDFAMDEASVRKGFADAQAHGFSRALFLTRVNRVLERTSRDEALSHVLGALTHTDWCAFSSLLEKNADGLVLYGRSSFVKAFKLCLPLMHLPQGLQQKLRVIPFEESRSLCIRGLMRIHDCVHNTLTPKQEES